jgi:hypothetical protein
MADDIAKPGVTTRDIDIGEALLPTPVVMAVTACMWLRFTPEERKHCEAIADRLDGLIEIRSA